jgi:hypothetical protein
VGSKSEQRRTFAQRFTVLADSSEADRLVKERLGVSVLHTNARAKALDSETVVLRNKLNELILPTGMLDLGGTSCGRGVPGSAQLDPRHLIDRILSDVWKERGEETGAAAAWARSVCRLSRGEIEALASKSSPPPVLPTVYDEPENTNAHTARSPAPRARRPAGSLTAR